MLADLVLLVHFGLVVFISLGFIIIPFGYKLGWSWTQNWNLRIIHLSIMGVVTFETVVGLTCPLTVLEHNLRSIDHSVSFAGFWIQKILFWDLPHHLFILCYTICFVWVIFLWKRCPPSKIGRKL